MLKLFVSQRLYSAKKSTIPVVANVAKVLKQAPNRDEIWSESQQPRNIAMNGPRFEQIDFSLQPQPPAAIELINSQPVIKVQGRIATCDGGGGALGHPKIYINLDSQEPSVCKYCGLRFQQEKHY